MTDQHRAHALVLVIPGDRAGALFARSVWAVGVLAIDGVTQLRLRKSQVDEKPGEGCHDQVCAIDPAMNQHDPRRRDMCEGVLDVVLGDVFRIERKQPLFQ